MGTRLLIIEDDPALNQMLALHFEDLGFQVFSATRIAEGRALARGQPLDIILLDQQLPDGEGIELLPQLRDTCPGTAVIMMTGLHDLELAIRAIKWGAADFIHKPLNTASLQAAIDRILASRDHEPEVRTPEHGAGGDLIGRSEAMLEVSKQIALCAANSATVLISGESGTGKEVVARLIHQHSNRSGPFVAINCAAIVDNLLESELFGHEKGAFTGADRSKPGKFELAAGGTLFLDEIAELAGPLQAKLLRALQERVIERVGGTNSIAVTARIVAATHTDLFEQVRAGRFREDLAYRLKVLDIVMPPLRERRDDIPLLANALLARAAGGDRSLAPALTRSAMHALQAHDWPGNVRELENVLTQALVLARDGQITARHIRIRNSPGGSGGSGTDGVTPLLSLDQMEANHIQKVLDYTRGHKGRSCEILGISRPALDRKIAKFNLKLPARE